MKRLHCAGGFPAAIMAVMAGFCVDATTTLAVEYPGPRPGTARFRQESRAITLENDVISVTWETGSGMPVLRKVTDRLAGGTLDIRTPCGFRVSSAGGNTLEARDFQADTPPRDNFVAPSPGAVRLAERFGGHCVSVTSRSKDDRLRMTWSASLRDGANYVRQSLTISINEGSLAVRKIETLRLTAEGAARVGTVDGSPVFADTVFFACEHPMAKNEVQEDAISCVMPRYRAVTPGDPLTASSVIGVVPKGQRRRAFLHYIERERARPYGPLNYYISWFDLAAPNMSMNAPECLDRIRTFGHELTEKRGVKFDAFVFDDGWDDNRTLWRFHKGFPEGFTPLAKAAAQYDAFLGTWISPWGGYGGPKARRLEHGRTAGFETNDHGFSLAGPKYYQRFREVCVEQLQKYGVGYLKFDGVGPGNYSAGAGEEYGPDIEALLRLIDDLREVRPDLFVNTTVGTWPSPYWLFHSDAVWRAGGDIHWNGIGSKRQQWMTYRDAMAYKIHTARGPLFPLNSLKFQSVMLAPLSLAAKLSNDPADLADDIRMAAASGTQLQEFFVRPSMVSPKTWDVIAETIKWTRANADVLCDSHAVGGDPGKGEVYGYASWSPRKGILALRNPSDKPATFDVRPKECFELPPTAAKRFTFRRHWTDATTEMHFRCPADGVHRVNLKPFELIVLEVVPVD